MHEVAVRIGEDLDLDVTRAIDELLQIDAGVLEGGLGLGPGRLERGRELRLVAADAHPLAAAAGGGLDQHRIADRSRQPKRLGVGGDHAVGARNARDLGRRGDLLGLGLQAHLADRLVRRPDELETARPADLRKVGFSLKKP